VDRPGHDRGVKKLLWIAIAVVLLIIVGSVVVSFLGTLLKLAFYLIVGAAVVGGLFYLFGRARQGGRSRQR
jgi:hypothetical protein